MVVGNVIGRKYFQECGQIYLFDLLPPPKRLCFRRGLSVRPSVCEQDNSKTYGLILMKFSGYV